MLLRLIRVEWSNCGRGCVGGPTVPPLGLLNLGFRSRTLRNLVLAAGIAIDMTPHAKVNTASATMPIKTSGTLDLAGAFFVARASTGESLE